MPPVRFEPTISAGERPQTYALDRTAAGTGEWINTDVIFWLPLLHVQSRLEFSTLFRTVDLTPRPSITAALNEHWKYYGFNCKYDLPYNKIVFISCAQINCSSVFRINEHEFGNKIFSIIMFEFRHKFLFFHNYRVLHKTVLRPYGSPPAAPIWVATWGWDHCLSVTEILIHTHTHTHKAKL